MFFLNRFDAARKLLPHLEKFRNKNAVILAIPRGGVPLGVFLAKALNLPFDLVLTKKIGHPVNREYAIGAVSLEGVILDEGQDVPASYIEEEIKRIRKRLQERDKLFMGHRKHETLGGRIIIVVDDGIATGYTLMATMALLRKNNPASIVVAVPVAPPSGVPKIKRLADELICLFTPGDFNGVGQYYEDFSEVTDEEVLKLLKEVA